jgi:hypothetical protein
MWYYKNLVAGQWQIGNLVFGRGTNIKVSNVDVASYDINAQDYQTARSDTKQFGNDQQVPTTIQFTINVLHNRLLPGWEGSIPNFWHSMPTIEDFAYEWRGDDVRNRWGEMKPLYHRSRLDDKAKIIYGRPGQFTPSWDDEYNQGEVVNVLAEFRRGDTVSYSYVEKVIVLDQAEPEVVINGHSGKAPTWMRILLFGPINHPIITLTNLFGQVLPVVVDFDYNVAEGEIVEISGYPWSRRIVNNASTPLALPRQLIGDTPYLDRLRFNFDAEVGVTLAGSGMTSESQAQVRFRDAYTVI